MKFPSHKTRIVCTIGPATRSKVMLTKAINGGMNVARLNFSHGEMEQHARDIRAIRAVSQALGVTVAILADLPGPKIRIGLLRQGSVMLERGQRVRLNVNDIFGTPEVIPVQFPDLLKYVRKGQIIYLNDGFIQLKVLGIESDEVLCRVIIGGRLLSHKGMNLPGTRLDLDPVTDKDLGFVDFGLQHGIDIFGVSFAGKAKDIEKVKDFIAARKKRAFVVAKIERKEAISHIDAILDVTDGIMVARGDLGVEIPIEKVPVVQKELIHKANLAGKPVITATQMLESMTQNIRPTRAEVTDVANAILDGTDAVMLSEETAIGLYPIDAIKMLARIARTTESRRTSIVSGASVRDSIIRSISKAGSSSEDVLSLDVFEAQRSLGIQYILAPTLTGGTPRRISRYKGTAWILAFCPDEITANFLLMSNGVMPFVKDTHIHDSELIAFVKDACNIKPGQRLLIARRLPADGGFKTNSLKIITLA
ncbi:MAG: pyruvate kinase [Deltaproteobacteria bacterium]|nr:pyruvate kinase [Deltaproteobacteria bacterium]